MGQRIGPIIGVVALVLVAYGIAQPPAVTLPTDEILHTSKQPAPAATNAHNIVQLAGPKLVKADGAEVDSSYLAKKDYILVYFSAHWCQPCRAFTPVLVKFYNDYADQGNFEVVFVSADQSQRDMFNYMTSEKMPWVAEPFSKRYGPLTDKYGARVIPNLVLIQPDGKVLSASFANGQSAGPSHVLVDLQQRLAQQKAQKATAAAKP